MILCDDILELLALVPDKTIKSKQVADDAKFIGSRKVTASELQKAQQAIKTKLLTKYKNIATALRQIDTKGDGTLSREEVRRPRARPCSCASPRVPCASSRVHPLTRIVHRARCNLQVIHMLEFNDLIKRVDYHTGALHGEITMAAADTLMDYVDTDKDGKLNYQEFQRVLTAENILHIPPPKSIAPTWGKGKFS